MSRWILLIFCACWVSLEARRLSHQNHGHHISNHEVHGKHLPRHLHTKRAKDSEEASDEDTEENSISSESSGENNEKVCQTEACRQTAQFIKKSMDESKDPCIDFERYTCGNWAKNYKIPPYMEKWMAWDLLSNTVNHQQKELLGKEIQSDDMLPLRLSKKWYQSCINTDELERKGVRDLVNILARIGGWPMAMEPGEWDNEAYPWQRVDKYYARLTGSPTFVKMEIVPEWVVAMYETNSSETIVQLEGLYLPLEEVIVEGGYNRSTFYSRDDYKKLIEETALAILEERGVDVSRDAIAKDIKEIFHFEKSLYRIFKRFGRKDDGWLDKKDSEEDKTSGDEGKSSDNSSNEVSDEDNDSEDESDSDDNEDFDRKIRRRTKKRGKKFLRRRILSEYSDEDEDEALNEAEMLVLKMNIWGQSLNAILKEVNLKRSDIELRDLVDEDDMKKLSTLLEETPNRVIVNYVHWKFISGMIQHTTERLRKLHFNAAGKTLGRKAEKPRWLWCLNQIGTKEVISYEYVKNYFPSDAKAVANSIIKRIRQVVDKKIEESPWMSEELKKAAKEKVDAMKALIGYPSWYDNSTEIEHYYKGLVINRGYFENVLNFKKYDYMKHLRKTGPPSTSIWSIISPLTANAMYMPSDNSLTLTAVDFQKPFFDVSQPAAINFGIIGYVIGHEVSHGFDPMGRMYDKDGKVQTWLPEDEEKYEKRRVCFVEKYSSYTLELKELNTTIHVDGERTVGDNVADCTGLEAVHGAYRIWREEQKDKKDQKLPGLEKFTDEQLFFLASAALWCNSATPEYAEYLLNYDGHSPMTIRILGAVSNNEHFADAFNCPKGSPMNPEKKCDIWK